MKAEKNKKLNITAVFLTLCLAVTQLFFPVSADASELIDTDAHSMIEINYMYEGVPVTDADFSIYRVGDVSENGELTLIAPFDGLGISLDMQNSSSVKQAAGKMAQYSTENDAVPLMSGKTDAGGTLYFPSEGHHMYTGLYLITGQGFEVDGHKYEVEPLLVQLPSKIENHNGWHYSVKVQPKSAEYIEGDEGTDKEYEKTPDGKLPQTGQLWWPVPMLLAAGMVLIIIGLLRGRRVDHDR